MLRPSDDPSWEWQSCALPGLFQSSNHFSKPLLRVFVCKSGHSICSGSFVFETLVCTRTLHPSELLLGPPLPVSITRLFLKASFSSYLVQIRPRQLLRTVRFRNSTHYHHPPVKRRCRDSPDGSAEPTRRDAAAIESSPSRIPKMAPPHGLTADAWTRHDGSAQSSRRRGVGTRRLRD